MAKAKKSETGSAPEGAGEAKKAAPKKPAAKKGAGAGVGMAPMTAIPAPSAQPAKPAAAKKPAAKKGGKNEPAKPAARTGSPMVDTSMAAESAARMLAGRAKHGGGSQSPQAGKESGLFKQLKQNVN